MKVIASVLNSSPLKVGFVGLSDAAPLVVAKEKGFFAQEGLAVHLSREVGWVTVRDKLLTGELQASQAPAPLLWASRLGLGGMAFPACTALILNLHGNALCLSKRLQEMGVHDAGSLRSEALRRRGENKLVLGTVHPFSSHNLHLRAWLKAAGLRPDHEVRIATLPPAQMLPTMKAGSIDGFMAGEPWTSLAVANREGWCAACSATLFPGHMEKVLMVREEFAETPRHAALVRALVKAGAWCDEPRNRAEVATLLSAPEYINLPRNVLLPALTGHFKHSETRSEVLPDFLIFHKGNAQHPRPSRALDLQHDLIAGGHIPAQPPKGLAEALFREDLYEEAMTPSPRATVHTE